MRGSIRKSSSLARLRGMAAASAGALLALVLPLALPPLPTAPAAAPEGSGPLPAAAVGATRAAGDSPPLWPLELGTRYLTSNFMEYRPGRYHAGLDLKTDSQVGFPVVAVQDGSVVRVRAGASAYGRAIYLRSAGGTTYVYGHLARFNDVIAAHVAQAQTRSGGYKAELEFKPGRIPVRAGEVLGLSGQSGTAGPHLHFEVRDRNQRPLNPLDHGFAVADTLAPVIEAVRAVPADPAALIGGAGVPMVAEATGRSGVSGPAGLRGTLAPLAIRGPVAFTVRAVDHADIRGHALEPYRIEAELDGQVVYSARNEAYDFADNALARLEWIQAGAHRERWLHRRKPVDLPGRRGDAWYLGSKGRGLAPGRHLLTVTAADQAGNRAVVTLALDVAASTDATALARPDARIWRAEARDQGLVIRKSHTDCRLTPFFADDCEDSTLVVRRLSPGRGDPVLAESVLWIQPWAPDPVALAQGRKQGLVATGPAAEYLAVDLPLESSLAVEFPFPPFSIPDPGSHPAMVYRWRQDRWSPAGDLLGGAGSAAPRLRFDLDGPGRYAVLRDTTPPRVLPPAAAKKEAKAAGPAAGVLTVGPGPRSRVPGVTLPRWEVIPLDVVEEGSGVAAESIRVLLDGRLLVVEPDLPRSRLLIELPDSLASGPHRLAVSLADRAGNGGKGDLDILCRQ